jgi:hypothetical protein
MKAALDRKGRPYYRCETCAAILFVRLGPIGVHSVANTLRLLEAPTAIEWVRAEAFKDASGPSQGLRELLGVNPNGAAEPAAGRAAEDHHHLKETGS